MFVGVRLPVQPHFWEGRVAIDSLKFVDRVSDVELPALGQVRILGLVKAVYRPGDPLHGGVGGVVICREGGDRLLFEIGQRRVEPAGQQGIVDRQIRRHVNVRGGGCGNRHSPSGAGSLTRLDLW